MSKRSFLWFFMVLSLINPSVSLSQTQEIKEYKVTTGDTLWDISRKELGDAFLWPKIWQENPEIANPDRLYPGQRIKIPLRYVQKEGPAAATEQAPVVPAEVPQKGEVAKKEVPAKQPPAAASVMLQPLINKNLLIAGSYIADSVSGVGKIAGSPTERNMFGNEDIVYVRTDNPVKLGDKFYILRAGELVKHPLSGKRIGYVVEMLGVAEIVRFENGETLAKITQMFADIYSGDLLQTYYEIDPPLTTRVYRMPDITGNIVASRFAHLANSKIDIVFIDKGLRDGVEIGDILKAVGVVGDHKVPTGKIQVISCQDTTSTAVVLENYYSPVSVGDFITQLEKN